MAKDNLNEQFLEYFEEEQIKARLEDLSECAFEALLMIGDVQEYFESKLEKAGKDEGRRLEFMDPYTRLNLAVRSLLDLREKAAADLDPK